MKILIVYSSKYGFTKKCINYIKERLECDVTVVDVNETSKIELNDYKWVIMGGSTYMGKMNKNLKRFAEQNINELLTKNVALFVSCSTPSDSDKYIQECFPEKIYEFAKFRTNFGGELQPNKLNFLERAITNMVTKHVDKKEETLYQNMDMLINTIN